MSKKRSKKEPKEELEIPAISLPPDESAEEEMVEEAPKAEEIFEPDRYGFTAEEVKPKKKIPYFWIGFGVGLTLAILTEVLFSIPYWIFGASRPDLLYPEIVLILICTILPGLLSRSIQKGLLGGLAIFAVTFALPFFTLIFGAQLLNPLAPLFSSTAFAAAAFVLFKDLFVESPFTEQQLANIQKWVWVIDLVLMFILMVIVVVFSAWLIKNITVRKKKVGNWIAIPLLCIGLIIFAIFVPLIFSATSGVIQASTAFLAGASKFSEAYTSFEASPGSLSFEQINGSLGEAEHWFSISLANYRGLRHIGVIGFATAVAGEYGPLIREGDQMALAAFSFFSAVVPLFNGLINLKESLNNATSEMASFGGGSSSNLYPSFILDENGAIAINDDNEELEALKETIMIAIQNIVAAHEAITEADASIVDATEDFQKIDLSEIDLEKLSPNVQAIFEEINQKIEQYKDKNDDYQGMVEYAFKVLEPTKYLLWTSYHTVVGNYYMINFRFDDATQSFSNALGNLTMVDPAAYELPEEVPIQMVANLGSLIGDILELMDPLLNEELYVAETLAELNRINNEFANAGFDVYSINWGELLALSEDAGTYANESLAYGIEATDKLQEIQAKLAADGYGDYFTEMGGYFETIFTSNFNPEDFGVKTEALSSAVGDMIDGCWYYAENNFTMAYQELQEANNALAAIDIPNTLPYFRDYLEAWAEAISSLQDTIEQVYNGTLTASQGATEIATALSTLNDAIGGGS